MEELALLRAAAALTACAAVLVTRTSPGPRCGATAALTNPVDVVRVPLTTKPVRWLVGDVQTVCP